MVVIPVVAPTTRFVATPKALILVAFVFKRLNSVSFVVMSPPSTFKSRPTFKFFSIPTPPSTIRAPVSFVVDSVVILILISAPVNVS
jgi:hypothetical protein